MAEPTNHQDTSSSSPPAPNTSSRWQKMRNWLLSALIIFVVSTFVDKVFERDSIDHIRQVNASFVKGIGAVDPFNLATIFYGYLFNGTPPKPAYTYIMGHAFLQPAPPAPPAGIVTVLLRVIPGAFYTVITIISGGWVSIIMAAIALFLGFVCVRSGVKEEESLGMMLLMVLAVPLIGGVFVWLLLQLMWLAFELLGGLLAGAEMVTAFSFVVPTLGWALVKKGEHDVTGKIIKGVTGSH